MKLLKITDKLLNEFLPQWNGFRNINEVVLNCIEINQINPINHLWYYSGGGNYHYFILDDDEHIWSFHVTDQLIEYSYNRWNSINDYLEIDIESKINDGIFGFGYEFKHPEYNKRFKNKKWYWYPFHEYENNTGPDGLPLEHLQPGIYLNRK